MLQIRLLGGMEVCLDNTPLPGLGAQLRRLLAFLTLQNGRPVENWLVWQALWADSETDACVRTSLKRLRQALGAEAERVSCGTARCASTCGAWMWIPSGLRC